MIYTRALYFVGLLFVAIAVTLTVRELQLAHGWIISILLLAFAISSEFLKGFGKTSSLVLFALAGITTPIGFFTIEKDIAFYVAIVTFFVLSTFLTLRNREIWTQFDIKNDDKWSINMDSTVVWSALILSSLSLSWGSYFKFLTSMQDEFIARRLIFTLFLVIVGIACSVAGRRSAQPFLAVTGLTFLGAGVAKALIYDTTHLAGFLRIGVFAGGGALLLLGGILMSKKRGTNA